MCTCVLCMWVHVWRHAVCAGVRMHVCPDLRLLLSVFLNFSLLHMLGLVLFWTQHTAFSSLSVLPALRVVCLWLLCWGYGQGTTSTWSFTWVLGSRLRSLCWCGEDFTCWAIFPTPCFGSICSRVGLKFLILLSLLSKCWDNWHLSLWLVKSLDFFKKLFCPNYD